MDPELFNMATSGSGNVDALDRRKRNDEEKTILLQRTHKMNDTALHIACKFGHKDFAAKIISLCPDLLLQQNSKLDTALHNAARNGHTDVVRKLIECAEKLNTKEMMLGMANMEGNTVLHEAATSPNEEVVKLLIEKMPKLASVTNTVNASPLYVAAEKGCKESVVEILKVLKGSEDVHCRGPHERTPLHAAVIRQHLEITKTLIEEREDYIAKEDELGNYPIHYAAANGNLQMVHEILKVNNSAAYQGNKKQQSPVYVASSYGHVKVIKELARFRPDSCLSVDKKGCNALHVAAKRGHLGVVKYILGSENPNLAELINERNEAGNTPLQLAISKGRDSVSIFLINDKRVEVNVKNKDGKTALDMAESQDKVTKKFIEVDQTGETAWDMAKSNKKVTKKFEQILICNALIQANGRRGLKRLGNRSRKLEERIFSYEDMFRVVPTIAALIITVSFAAAFTIPGGFNSRGKAVLEKKVFMWLFIVTDSLALFASIIVGLTLLLIANLDNAQCNVDILIAAHSISINLMGISLVSLALAFLFGLLSIVPIVLVGVLFIVLLCLLGLVLLWIGFLPWFPSLHLYLKRRIKDKLSSIVRPSSSHQLSSLISFQDASLKGNLVENQPSHFDPVQSPASSTEIPTTSQPQSSNQVKSQPTNQGTNLPQVSSQVEIQTTNESQSPASVEIQQAIVLWNSVSNEIPPTNQPQSSVSHVIPILDIIRSHTGTSLSSETQTAHSNSLQNLNMLVNLPVTFTANLISTENPVLHLIRYFPQQTTSPQSFASSVIPHTNQPERLVSSWIGDALLSSIPSSTMPHAKASFTSSSPLTQSCTPLQNSSPTQVHYSHNPFTLTNPSRSPARILHTNQPDRSVSIEIGDAHQSSNTEASFTSSTSLQNSSPTQFNSQIPFPALTNPTQLPAHQQSETSNRSRNENQHWDTFSNRGRNEN